MRQPAPACPVCNGSGRVVTGHGYDACGRCMRLAEAEWKSRGQMQAVAVVPSAPAPKRKPGRGLFEAAA